jgi:hypothetical protein
MQFLLQLRRNARVLGAVRQIFVLICSEIVRLIPFVIVQLHTPDFCPLWGDACLALHRLHRTAAEGCPLQCDTALVGLSFLLMLVPTELVMVNVMVSHRFHGNETETRFNLVNQRKGRFSF